MVSSSLSRQEADHLLQLGLAQQKRGDLAQAATTYRLLLARSPNHGEALHLLGIVHLLRGEMAAGIIYLRTALTITPRPTYRLNLGKALIKQGVREEALSVLRPLWQTPPLHPLSLRSAAQALLDAGWLVEAEEGFRALLPQQADDPEIWNALGVIAAQRDRREEGLSHIQRALTLKPDYARALANLGSMLSTLGRLEEAESPLRQAIQWAPEMAGAYHNLGNTLAKMNRRQEAVAQLQRAVALEPDFVEAQNSLGFALLQLARHAEAEEHLRRAIRLKPDYHDAHFNLSLLLLLQGRFQEGWEAYEHRLFKAEFTQPPIIRERPFWHGESLTGKSLLIWGEQGFGDKIQFFRYLPFLKKAFPTAVIRFYVPTPLWNLFAPAAAAAEIELVPEGKSAAFDYHLPLLSLPHRLATRLANIPAEAPYLAVAASLQEQWRHRLADIPSPRIGLVWAGSSTNPRDRCRSIPPDILAPLGRVAGITWISLQKDLPPDSQMALERLLPIRSDIMPQVRDFADTAALILQLDRVITVDTAVAHVAGALGKPVWLLNRFDSEWRWLWQRDNSPWYPGMTLFGQKHPGDWAEVVERVVAALERELRRTDGN